MERSVVEEMEGEGLLVDQKKGHEWIILKDISSFLIETDAGHWLKQRGGGNVWRPPWGGGESVGSWNGRRASRGVGKEGQGGLATSETKRKK